MIGKLVRREVDVTDLHGVTFSDIRSPFRVTS